MDKTVKKSFDSPEEVRSVPKARIEVVSLGDDVKAMRCTFDPDWKWSECVKPIAGTESCEVEHLGYFISGEMTIRMDDGTEHKFKAGDAATVPPGHDAWITSAEPCVFVDFQ